MFTEVVNYLRRRTLKILLSVSNSKSSSITFYIEPWGEDYTVLPKECYDIRFPSKSIQTVSAAIVVLENNEMQIYLEGVMGKRALKFGVYNGEQLLELSHNRRPD